jgi:glycosyltransferase involved in cell wall biosynthesis
VGKASQFKVIPLGLDLNVFAGSTDRRNMFRRELAIEGDVILVGIVGRLTHIKNHRLFLKTVARFKRDCSALLQASAVRFVIIGDGSMRPSLEKLVHSLGLERDVIFAGSRKDPEKFYPALDVVALTSRNEGTPLTLIEAMANGRPVIATKVGGVVDLLGEPLEVGLPYQICERGVSVPPDNEEAFAAGMRRLVGDVVLRRELGMRGQEFVERNYRKERLLEDIKELYGELLRCEAAAMNAESAKRRLESRI